jgi:transcriptional regulator with XRE-family HTH domain
MSLIIYIPVTSAICYRGQIYRNNSTLNNFCRSSFEKKLYMDIKERLRALMVELKISQRRFEESCGMGNGTINNIKYGLASQNLEKIINAFPSVNIEWLISGRGDMFKSSNQGKEEEKNESVSMREVFDQISKLTNTIASQQKTIEYLQNENEKMSARMVIAENAAGGAQAV